MQQYEQQLVEARNRIAALEREVATADNVRSFAAETEREIAQLQRERRDLQAKLTQMTLERDRLAIEVRDSLSEGDTTSRRAPIAPPATDNRRKPAMGYDPEATAALDIARIEQMIARSTELEQKLVQYEREVGMLRAQLRERDDRLAELADSVVERPATVNDPDPESTRTG